MNKPKIRFKGYEDAWEQRKLGDICESFEYGLNAASKEYDGENKYIRITDIDDSSHEFLQEDVTSPDMDLAGAENYRLKYGDILFARTGASVGKTYIYKDSDSLVYYAGFLIRGHVKNDFSPEFVFQNTLTDDYNRFIRITSQRSGQPGVNAQEYASYEISAPSFAEQQKIGLYFSYIDHLITLHQRKCEETKTLKKYMLQKMFPQSGTNVPEIRFGGFTDAWEQRKLSEVYQNIGNAFVGTATPYYVEEGHFYLESNNVKDGQINHNTEIFINDEFYERQKDKWLHTGDMVMVQSGHVGHAAVIPEEMDNTAAHALIMFRNSKVSIEPYFLNYQFQTDKSKKKIENITTGNTIKHILASDMQNFIIDVPDYAEQGKIAQYFCNLDHLITLHQHKCEELRNIKKFMMQNMFV